MLGPSHRTAGLLAAGALVVGWLSASLVVPPSAISQSRAGTARPPAAPEIPPIALSTVAAPRLRPSGARNPFAFGAAPAPGPGATGNDAGRSDEVAAIADDPAGAGPAGEPAPAWRIAGIAIDAAASYTAIVVGDGNVHLLKVGDQFAGADVIEITASQMTLKPSAGDPIVLRLP